MQHNKAFVQFTLGFSLPTNRRLSHEAPVIFKPQQQKKLTSHEISETLGKVAVYQTTEKRTQVQPGQ